MTTSTVVALLYSATEDASFCMHNLHNHRQMTFLDLQSRFLGIAMFLPLIVTLGSVMTNGHCRHPPPLQHWLDQVQFLVLICLLRTTVFPIELRFFIANIMCTSPINISNSSLKLWITPLKSLMPSKQWTGKTRVSQSKLGIITVYSRRNVGLGINMLPIIQTFTC